ncbi:hypothetical protein FJTKL_03909 [Diaporthe vaccinii]|uniref:Uncharacterized protein n=1 Tax=Diaporthe vaccinii TaxID=105482 RepID=A0ABR4F1I0_9PEZI
MFNTYQDQNEPLTGCLLETPSSICVVRTLVNPLQDFLFGVLWLSIHPRHYATHAAVSSISISASCSRMMRSRPTRTRSTILTHYKRAMMRFRTGRG